MQLKSDLCSVMIYLAVVSLACSRSQPIIELASDEKLAEVRGQAKASPSPTSTLEPFTPPANVKYLHVSDGVMLGAARKKVQPRYPLEAMTKGVTGNVRVQITIDTEGKVVEAKILSGHALLQEAALQAAREWKYKPLPESWPWLFVVGTLEFKFPPQ